MGVHATLGGEGYGKEEYKCTVRGEGMWGEEGGDSLEGMVGSLGNTGVRSRGGAGRGHNAKNGGGKFGGGGVMMDGPMVGHEP